MSLAPRRICVRAGVVHGDCDYISCAWVDDIIIIRSMSVGVQAIEARTRINAVGKVEKMKFYPICRFVTPLPRPVLTKPPVSSYSPLTAFKSGELGIIHPNPQAFSSSISVVWYNGEWLLVVGCSLADVYLFSLGPIVGGCCASGDWETCGCIQHVWRRKMRTRAWNKMKRYVNVLERMWIGRKIQEEKEKRRAKFSSEDALLRNLIEDPIKINRILQSTHLLSPLHNCAIGKTKYTSPIFTTIKELSATSRLSFSLPEPGKVYRGRWLIRQAHSYWYAIPQAGGQRHEERMSQGIENELDYGDFIDCWEERRDWDGMDEEEREEMVAKVRAKEEKEDLWMQIEREKDRRVIHDQERDRIEEYSEEEDSDEESESKNKSKKKDRKEKDEELIEEYQKDLEKRREARKTEAEVVQTLKIEESKRSRRVSGTVTRPMKDTKVLREKDRRVIHDQERDRIEEYSEEEDSDEESESKNKSKKKDRKEKDEELIEEYQKDLEKRREARKTEAEVVQTLKIEESKRSRRVSGTVTRPMKDTKVLREEERLRKQKESEKLDIPLRYWQTFFSEELFQMRKEFEYVEPMCEPPFPPSALLEVPPSSLPLPNPAGMFHVNSVNAMNYPSGGLIISATLEDDTVLIWNCATSAQDLFDSEYEGVNHGN
ncbi:hypothetical protein ADUPG1_007812 [Aduncisulcus paluster]|uniref:Uncharacterized protein n=1 Tax=Aduncisulcus paluster TaxID=2918883 RepID=A0ABQ5KR30_9EUKA|nr:hypothetical protein ADUPG1_007812 [Aduncisulcus paluster]